MRGVVWFMFYFYIYTQKMYLGKIALASAFMVPINVSVTSFISPDAKVKWESWFFETECFLCRKMLLSKILGYEILKNSLGWCYETVKGCSIESVKQLCGNHNTECIILLLHWINERLSRGRFLTRIFEGKGELLEHVQEKSKTRILFALKIEGSFWM